MSASTTHRITATLLLTVLTTLISHAAQANTIVVPDQATRTEKLAAHEVRRYIYARTAALLELASAMPAQGPAIVVCQKDNPLAQPAGQSAAALGPQDYLLKTLDGNAYIVGGSGIATLYAAYRFAEHLGVQFFMHGDILPDQQTPFSIPLLDETASPLFNLRGIQPFHDFPEGPDWWNTDTYKAIISQLPKMGMNFIGLHTYPEHRPNAEPTVWIGPPEKANPDGTVTQAYPALYYTTALQASWGFDAKKTSQYALGAGMLYDRDAYGADVMRGFEPCTDTPGDCNELFNRTGAMLREAFEWAHTLGIKTCVGTETPLVVPERIANGDEAPGKDTIRNLYEGIFARITHAYPLDYYWFWTPEGWTWQGVEKPVVQKTIDDILTAAEAARNVDAPFQLATCGWVLGPQYDRALFDKILPKDMPVSCINRQVGHEPVDPGFANVEGRPKWAIPWLEDDPALHSTQLWVGRMRRDARDALAYGCTGLMGIHWRTRILGPNVSALAKAAWDQEPWDRPLPFSSGVLGGKLAHFPGAPIEDTEDDDLYRHVRYDMGAYRFEVPNGAYTVTLQCCEPHYKEAGKRVFGVKLEGQEVIDKLDIFAEVGGNRALDRTFEGIEVKDGVLDIDFTRHVELPCIAAIVVKGPEKTIKINCGGEAFKDYAPDLEEVYQFSPTDDFYGPWAQCLFGEDAAQPIAALFERIDGRLPRPSDWVDGPGGYRPNPKPWAEVAKDYAFVDEFAALRPQVKGSGNVERFNYWLNNFQFMRATAHMCCIWDQFNKALEQAKAQPDAPAQAATALEKALPLRKDLIAIVAEAYEHLLNTVTTTGAMGSVTNYEQHTFPVMLDRPGQELAQLLGESLPKDAQLPPAYDGPPRVFIHTVRTSIAEGEPLEVRAITLAPAQPQKATLHWRPLGQDEFRAIAMKNMARGAYTAAIESAEDFEYYVHVTPETGENLYWPPTAPDLNQTVVLF